MIDFSIQLGPKTIRERTKDFFTKFQLRTGGLNFYFSHFRAQNTKISTRPPVHPNFEPSIKNFSIDTDESWVESGRKGVIGNEIFLC
jgi:hypothetical protein